MIAKLFIRLSCVAALALAGAGVAGAQEGGKTKDAALDSLLGDLKKDAEDGGQTPKKTAKKAEAAKVKAGPGAEIEGRDRQAGRCGRWRGEAGPQGPGRLRAQGSGAR